jgi:hypothetical protein
MHIKKWLSQNFAKFIAEKLGMRIQRPSRGVGDNDGNGLAGIGFVGCPDRWPAEKYDRKTER